MQKSKMVWLFIAVAMASGLSLKAFDSTDLGDAVKKLGRVIAAELGGEFELLQSALQLQAIGLGAECQKAQRFTYYEKKTREFLGYLNCPNAQTAPISAMQKDDERYQSCAGYAGVNGIVLNLDRATFDLFTCAHEAAHYALKHHKSGRPSLEVEQEADCTAARLLCLYGHRPVVEFQISQLYMNNTLMGYEHHDGMHPSYEKQYAYLSAILCETDTQMEARLTQTIYHARDPYNRHQKHGAVYDEPSEVTSDDTEIDNQPSECDWQKIIITAAIAAFVITVYVRGKRGNYA